MLGYFILRALAPRSRALHAVTPAEPDVPLRVCFGENFFSLIRGKSIIDYGCGEGRQCVEMAQRGAARVVGIDINEQWLGDGRPPGPPGRGGEPRGVCRCAHRT